MPPLPTPATPLVGRDRELAWAQELLLRHRFVTLFGPGGLGKTRLALELTTRLATHFPDGVYFVPLETVTETAQVLPRLAQALGVALTTEVAPPLALRRYLHARQVLLVLDCFEHMVAAAPALATLVEVAPQLHVLVTSRVALNVRGEQLYEVPPLPAPPTPNLAFTQLVDYPALQLFLTRAQAVQPTFKLTSQNAVTLIHLCQRLDGLPLAIELAAAQLRDRPLEAIALGLDEQFERLTLTPEGARPQTQTLRALLDWSHEALPADEKALFRRLSVFAGGWSLEAVEAVCAPLPAGGEALTCLLRLAEQSLVQAQPQGDDVRYRLLDSIRVYAVDQLESAGESQAFQTRHASYFLQLAEQAEPALTGPQQAQWFDRLGHEHDNLRAALRFALAHQPVWAVRLVAAVRRFWMVRGFAVEGRLWAEAAVTAAEAHPAPVRDTAWAKALMACGIFAAALRDFSAARARYDQALQRFRVLGDSFHTAIVLNYLGLVESNQRQYPAARAYFEECFALFSALNDLWGMPMPLINLGYVAMAQGHDAEAEPYFARSLELNRAAADSFGIAFSLDALGGIALQRGDWPRATALYTEALALRRTLQHQQGIAEALDNLGTAARLQQQWALAAQYYQESLALRRDQQQLWGEALSWIHLGRLAAAQTQWATARAAYCASLRLYAKHLDDWLAQQAVEGLALLQVAAAPAPTAEAMTAALHDLSLSERLRQNLAIARSPWDEAAFQQARQTARAALDETTYQTAWETGQTATLAAVMDHHLALAEQPHD